MHSEISFWEQDTFLDKIDVLIVGGGIVGLNAALQLRAASPNLNITLVERGSIALGASTKNAGFACFGSMTELLDDLAQNGEEQMLSLVEKRWKGLLRLRTRIGDEAMEFNPCGGFEVFGAADKENYETAMAAMDNINRMLAPIINDQAVFCPADEQMTKLGLKGFEHLILNRFEGQIHTGKMMQRLIRLAQAANIQLLNGVNITRFEEKGKGVDVHTSGNWVLKTKYVLICTNGFTAQLFPALQVQPARNQVIITAPIPGLKTKGTFHYNKGYVYFRNVGDRILLGGGRHLFPREETTSSFGLTEPIQTYLEDFLKTHLLPQGMVNIDLRWSGILGVGDQKSPIVTQYSDRIFTAVRLGGMGIAIGSLVGEEAANLVLESI